MFSTAVVSLSSILSYELTKENQVGTMVHGVNSGRVMVLVEKRPTI